MKWQNGARQFGLRFAICFVVLGILYALSLGIRGGSHNPPATRGEKLAAVRSALNQSYLASDSLQTFRQNDPLSYYYLNQSISHLTTSNEKLGEALKEASKELSPDTRARLETVLTRQQRSASLAAAGYSQLSRVITYDPTDDLGTLTLPTEIDKLTRRAKAAQDGTQKATTTEVSANSSSSDLQVERNTAQASKISSATRKSLLSLSGCFGRLAAELQANQLTAATETRSNCTKDYPKVRALAIHDIIGSSFDAQQEPETKQLVTQLVKELDAAIEED